MNNFSFFIILIKFVYILSPIPNWNLSTQANILDTTDPIYYTIYEEIAYDLKVILKKKIEKSGNNINSQNILYVYEKGDDNQYNTFKGERIVTFNAIDSHYKGKLGYNFLICPKGKFQPYDFDNSRHINNPDGFSENENDDWDLRCHAHNTGYFYLFYLLKNGNNFFYKYTGGYVSRNYVYSYFYDYMYEDGYNGDTQYKFCVLRYDGANDGVIRLCPESLSSNLGNGDVNQVSKGSCKDLNKAKSKTQACFNNDRYLFYFTYNDASDFESGYSTNSINFNSDSEYSSSVNNIQITKKTESPLTFVDNVEIQEMNFITGTKYAYYKIYNKDKAVTYYGLLDTAQSKILYNVQAEFTTFIPASTSSTIIMLGLTGDTV